MTDPIPALTPEYVAVIFTSIRTDDHHAEYALTAERMEELARQQEGYLGIESARGADGLGITISYWRDLESARAWKQVAEHRQAQAAGRERFYSRYRVRIARVQAEYGFNDE